MAEERKPARQYTRRAPTAAPVKPAAAEKPEPVVEKAPVAEEAPKERTYTETELNAIVSSAVSQAIANLQAAMSARQAPLSERVMLLWQAEVADDCVTEFGEHGMYGRITGKSGSFFVPKDELSRILDGMTRTFLDRRWLIVVSGLDEEEREALHVNYKEGELLDRQAFARLAKLGRKLLEIYPLLCEGHREIVAHRLYEAWTEHEPTVTRDLVRDLLKQSRELGAEDATFKQILTEMNATDVDE